MTSEEIKKNPTIDAWVDEDHVKLVITNPSIVEYEGELVPGLELPLSQVLHLISAFTQHALTLVEEK